jgi:hypothetical protein
MIACLISRSLQSPLPVIYDSWASTASFVATRWSQVTTIASWMAQKPIL